MPPEDYDLKDLTNPYSKPEEFQVLGGEATTDRPSVTLTQMSGIVDNIMGKFERCKTERLTHEERWMRQSLNFRGQYGKDTQFRDSEQSRVFVKITKTKVLAAFNQVCEVLFQGNRFPLSVEPTQRPEGIAEYAHLNPNAPPEAEEKPQEDIYGWEGDGRSIAPGATMNDLLGGLKDQYQGADLKEGPAPDNQTMPMIKPAAKAAVNMQKAILDQIDETDGHIWLKKAIYEMCLLGQGVLKGPFTKNKTLHNWKIDEHTKQTQYDPINEDYPCIAHVSTWDFYPDPDAKNMFEAEFVIERHKLSRTALRDLAKRPYFRKSAIEAVISAPTQYVEDWWETSLKDSSVMSTPDRYEVLEYWGTLDKYLLEEEGISGLIAIPDHFTEYQVNVWVCNGEILRCVLNPFTPAKIPYHSCPYEEHPYQMWGVGVAENMEDAQEIMNAFARLGVDNAALASNLVFDIDESSLVEGQDMKMYPGKIFRRQAGQPGQAVYGLKFPNVFTEAFGVFDRFRQLSDESTGLPSYSHGQTGVTSTTRTSSGLSMLMGAAALNIKGVIKNIDDYVLQPLGEGYFHWNMQFNVNPEVKGDLTIKARGTSGLMAKEIKSQRLLQFLQTVANPMLAPFAKFEKIIKEIAETMDLDPAEFTNDPTEAAIYAQMIGMAGGLGGSPQGQSGSPPKMDASGVGGANIGQGNVPTPGTPGFTGNPQESGTQAQSANAPA